MLEVKLDQNQHAPEATTGSHSPEKQISYFNPNEWQVIASQATKPQIQTIGSLLETNTDAKIRKFYAESVGFGHLGIHDSISEQEAKKTIEEHDEEEHVDKHETGHYLAALSFGYEATATSIPGPGFRGLTRWWGSTADSIKNRLWRIVVIAEAGAVGAGDNNGAGSDHGQSRYYASLLSHYFNEGSISSIISSAKSEASSRIQRGSQRFKETARRLFFKKTI